MNGWTAAGLLIGGTIVGVGATVAYIAWSYRRIF